MVHHIPPSPPKHWLWGHLRDFNNDSLRFLEYAATVGDIVTIQFGLLRGYFINHPDYVREILTSQAKSYRKPPVVRRALNDITGKIYSRAMEIIGSIGVK